MGVDNPNLGRSVLCCIEAKFSKVKYFQKGFEIDKVDTLLHRSKLSFRIFTHNLGEQIQKDFAILRYNFNCTYRKLTQRKRENMRKHIFVDRNRRSRFSPKTETVCHRATLKGPLSDVPAKYLKEV